MRTLQVLLAFIIALALAQLEPAGHVVARHPMITPAPVAETLENRQSDDCEESRCVVLANWRYTNEFSAG